MNIPEILEELKKNAHPENKEGMSKYGIETGDALGVPIPILRKMAKDIGQNHDLALQLWDSGIHEAKILASLVADAEKLTSEQMNDWARDFDSWDVCDGCCLNLFYKTPFAYQKVVEWSLAEEEFVKRAAFALMTVLVRHDKKAGDSTFADLFPIIEREADDDRNYVRKAVNWALRGIGKRNSNLNSMALEVARRLLKRNSKSARWIASDAIRELESKAVQDRLVCIRR